MKEINAQIRSGPSFRYNIEVTLSSATTTIEVVSSATTTREVTSWATTTLEVTSWATTTL